MRSTLSLRQSKKSDFSFFIYHLGYIPTLKYCRLHDPNFFWILLGFDCKKMPTETPRPQKVICTLRRGRAPLEIEACGRSLAVAAGF